MKDFYHSWPSSSDRNSYGIFEKINPQLTDFIKSRFTLNHEKTKRLSKLLCKNIASGLKRESKMEESSAAK